MASGVPMLLVLYMGSCAAHPDLLAGRTALYIDTISAIQSQVKGGNVRAIAVSTSKRSMLLPDVRAKLEAAGIEIQGGTPQAYTALIKSDLAKWGKVVKEAGIQPK